MTTPEALQAVEWLDAPAEHIKHPGYLVLSKSDLIYIREAIEKCGMNSVSLPVNIITGNVVGGREQVSLDYEEMIRREAKP